MANKSPYERVMRGAVIGPTVREELGPCLDFRVDTRVPRVIVGRRPHRTYLAANRVVLEQKLGRPIREGFWALHHCDRRRCINDMHLYEGTPKDNVRDRDSRTGNPFKALQHKGELHPEAKLNAEAVKVIRFLTTKGRKQIDLARVYGVSNGLISRIIRNKCWQHV